MNAFAKITTAMTLGGLLAFSASAAQVSVYGRIDTGFSYLGQDLGNGSEHSFSMGSGLSTGSRVGIRGEEDLGNGWKAGFILENQFMSDTGALRSSVFWERESSISLAHNSWGKLQLGRLGYIRGAVSSAGWLATYSPFATVAGSYIVGSGKTAGNGCLKANNSIVYTTPVFSGLQASIQYSLANTDEGTNDNSDNRYVAAAARYQNGPVNLAMIVDSTLLTGDKTKSVNKHTKDNPFAVTVAGTYDMTSVKLYGIASYFLDSDLPTLGEITKASGTAAQGFDGFGITLGASVPVSSGELKFAAGYFDADDVDSTASDDVTRWHLGAGYQHRFSKRTYAYLYTGYAAQKQDHSADQKGYEAICGLLHFF